MTAMPAEQQGYLEDFEKLSARASRNGGAWAGDLRRRAMECFPLPGLSVDPGRGMEVHEPGGAA